MQAGEQDLCQAHYQPQNEEITMTAYIDRSSIELFVDNGRLVMSNRMYFNGKNITFSLLSKEDSLHIQKLTIWQLNPTLDQKVGF